MPLTNPALTVDLNRRLGVYAALADLPSAFAWAARECVPGFSSASPFSVTDAELSTVTDGLTNQFLDLVLYRATDTIFRNISDESLRMIGVSDETKNVYASWERRVKRLRDDLSEKYGFGLMSLGCGLVEFGFDEECFLSADGIPEGSECR